MAYYPIFVELADKRVLVVGGGRVAEEKVAGLLRAEAAGRVRVVAPELSQSLRALVDEGKLEWKPRAYREGDMAGFDFVMVATDDGKVNAAVAAEGKRRKIWVNAADDPANCDFILPGVVRQGPVVLAASTSGASPALARRLREELSDFLSEDFAPLAELLDEVRHELRSRGVRPDPEAWQKAIDGQLRALLAQRRWGQAKARLLRSLGVADLLQKGVGYEDEPPSVDKSVKEKPATAARR